MVPPPFWTGPCEVGDPEMGAPLRDENLGDVSRGAAAEEPEGKSGGEAFTENSRHICGRGFRVPRASTR